MIKTSALALIISALALTSCAHKKVLTVDNAQEELLRTQEFETAVQVKDLPADESTDSGLYVKLPGPEPVAGSFTKSGKAKKTAKADTVKNVPTNSASGAAITTAPPGLTTLTPAKKKVSLGAQPVIAAATPPPAAKQAIAKIAASAGMKHEPSMEDGQGFFGRRPVKDPYRVGEKVTLEMSYFSVVAGDMTAEVRNFAEVNGRKSYRFAGTAKSSSVFSMFYAVEDWFETFVDFETMIPQSYALHVKESKQLREVRTVFDWSSHKASYYDKKINEEKKLEQETKEWAIPDYAQNVFSAAFYLRAFDLRPGFHTSFHVSHEGKNLLLTADYVRKEKISTAAGDFECIVIKPTISLDGKFTPIGDVFVWYTNDDRKLMVRIESKIKIGKIVGVAKAVERGQP